MDINSILGLLIAFGGIVVGQLLEGGSIHSLLQLTAFLIVFGGTLGAVLVQSPLPVFIRGVKMSRSVLMPPVLAPQRLVQQVSEWSHAARKEGLLSLESQVEATPDQFMKKGLQLLVDGTEPEKLREALEIEIGAFEESQQQAAKIWEAAGGYSPTMGILGAVLGLIHVMENLADPSKLGAGIAVAFVATVYGVGLANMVYLPIAAKLKQITAQQVVVREMLVAGLVAIANGENPRVIEGKLQGYIA